MINPLSRGDAIRRIMASQSDMALFRADNGYVVMYRNTVACERELTGGDLGYIGTFNSASCDRAAIWMQMNGAQ